MFNKALLAAAAATLTMCAAVGAQAGDQLLRLRTQDEVKIANMPYVSCQVTGGGDFRTFLLVNAGRVTVEPGRKFEIFAGQYHVGSVSLRKPLQRGESVVAWYGNYSGGGCSARED